MLQLKNRITKTTSLIRRIKKMNTTETKLEVVKLKVEVENMNINPMRSWDQTPSHQCRLLCQVGCSCFQQRQESVMFQKCAHKDNTTLETSDFESYAFGILKFSPNYPIQPTHSFSNKKKRTKWK